MNVEGRLESKVAIICGAGQTPGETIGNGKAIALLFARAGAKVLCVDRVSERAAQTAADIEAERGIALPVTADVTQAEDAERIVQTALEQFQRLDILVNNVGIGGGGDGPADRLSEDAFDRILRVNLKGAWLVTKAALPVLKQAKQGSIVNISSLAAVAGGFQMAYETSKAALNRMTRSVAVRAAKHQVRCNAVMPGLMDTPMAIAGISSARGIPADRLRAERSAQVPMQHMGDAWDTAYAALFLASDESKFVSGAILPVDGAQGAKIG